MPESPVTFPKSVVTMPKRPVTLFRNTHRDGKPMTRANVAQCLKRAAQVASCKYPDLINTSVSPHMVRCVFQPIVDGISG